MATETRDANGIALTQQEAEAVIELWAKKQADTEALRSRLTVEDMAEAMSLPRSEVEQMLRAVRMHKALPPEPVLAKKVRPVNSLLIAIASAVWIVILIGACYAAYEKGQGDARRQIRLFGPPAVAGTPVAPLPSPEFMEPPVGISTPAPAEETVLEFRDLGRSFSARLSIVFDGVTIVGLQDHGARNLITSNSLGRAVRTISTAPSININSGLSDLQIVKLLRTAKNPPDGAFEFKSLRLEAGGKSVSEMVPVALTQSERIGRLVTEEQVRRLKILANKAEQQLDL